MNSADRANKFGCSGGLIPLFRYRPRFCSLRAMHWNYGANRRRARPLRRRNLQNSLLIPLLFENINEFNDQAGGEPCPHAF
jgi:hypothetical protein